MRSPTGYFIYVRTGGQSLLDEIKIASENSKCDWRCAHP